MSTGCPGASCPTQESIVLAHGEGVHEGETLRDHRPFPAEQWVNGWFKTQRANGTYEKQTTEHWAKDSVKSLGSPSPPFSRRG